LNNSIEIYARSFSLLFLRACGLIGSGNILGSGYEDNGFYFLEGLDGKTSSFWLVRFSIFKLAIRLGTSLFWGEGVPTWLSNQKELDLLDLGENQLIGSVPLWLTGLQIGSLIISENDLN
jgi:hypothetical protein